MTTPLTYTLDDMRTVFQLRDAASLRRLLDALAPHGFPPRLPHVQGAKALWSRPAVDNWMKHWGQGTSQHPSQRLQEPALTTLRNQLEARHATN